MSSFKFFIILLTGFVDYLGIGLVYPVFAALLFDVQDPILDPSTSVAVRGAFLGVLIALTPISQFFFAPILGAFSDRKGRRIALLLGVSTGFVGYCTAILGICTHSIILLFLYRFLVGVSDATASVAQAALSDISTEETKSRRFSLLNSAMGFGFTVGPFLGGKLADTSFAPWCGYALPFIVAGGLSLLNLLMIFWKFPETRQASIGAPFEWMKGMRDICKVFLWKQFRWLFVAGFCCAFAWSFFNEFIPLLLRSRFAYTLGEVGNYYAFTGGLYALFSALLALPIFIWCRSENLISKLFLLCGISMWLFTVINEGYHIWWIMPVMMYCLAIVYPGLTSIVSDRADKDIQGEVLGVYNAIQAAAMGISPLIVGSAVGAYPPLAAWGGAFAMFSAGLAFWLSSRWVPAVVK